MVRTYVIGCYLFAFVSLVPWLLMAITLIPTPGTRDTTPGAATAAVIVGLLMLSYPVWLSVFGVRSWRFFREGDDLNAAGPSTLIGVPALILLLFFVAGR